MIRLAELFRPDGMRNIRLARQVGVTHAIMQVRPVLSTIPRSGYLTCLQEIDGRIRAAGMVFAGVESHPVDAEKIKLGLPGRDEELENYLAAIRALGQIGVPLLCYNWMAGLGWYRTRCDVPARGGALTSEFDNSAANEQGPTQWGEVSEENIWANLEYFLKAVIPAAEQAGVRLALHPDDPPLSPLRGIGRILTSAASFRRILAMAPSPVNGIAFCQANFRLMGEDIAALAAEWCFEKRIFFVHLRDVEGTAGHFRETFHDNGPTNMARILKIYHECGFDGPIRPDHAPTLEGESNDEPGYAMGGKLFAFGYMKGVMDALNIPYL